MGGKVHLSGELVRWANGSYGHHLWGRLSSLRALQAGAILAVRLKDPLAAEYYDKTAKDIEAGLSEFWINNTYWASSLADGPHGGDTSIDRSQIRALDCGFTLAVLHGHTPSHNGTSSPNAFDPAQPGVLSTLRLLAKSFKGEYAINHGEWTDGWLLGRYRGDEYDGIGKSKANPWYLDQQ